MNEFRWVLTFNTDSRQYGVYRSDRIYKPGFPRRETVVKFYDDEETATDMMRKGNEKMKGKSE